ncbi:MAG: tRNA (guanine-N7)-methyltransferase [Bdellovibrionales bacterium]|nr:tRNA (guanine-N7)-methyltransferase [Bdellovibrionales bacterium]
MTESNEKNVSKRIINLTRELPVQNQYTLALDNEYKDFAFNEERAPMNQGKWRSEVFKVGNGVPLDLEIGTGTGYFFNEQAKNYPDRMLLGIELKYKPLIQTIRRAKKAGAKNVAVCRYHGFNIEDLFVNNELNNIFIHFPDPWVSPKKPKNRMVQKLILDKLYDLQMPGAFLEFKTDSLVYFDWALDEIKNTKYNIEFCTYDLHNSEKAKDNFITGFEAIFLKQQIKINYVLLRK